MEKKKSAQFLIIEGMVNVNDTNVSKKINNADVVFHGNKLIKNIGGTITDKVGTLFAKSEISKAQRGYKVSTVESL
jgi:hypothetical protein